MKDRVLCPWMFSVFSMLMVPSSGSYLADLNAASVKGTFIKV